MEIGISAKLTERNNATTTNNNNIQLTNSKKQFILKRLFRNTAEYIVFDKRLGEKKFSV